MGCTLPALGNPSSTDAAAIQKNSSDQSQTDQMAGMENCPHQSGGSVPAKANDGKPVRSGAMSCCPLEITVALKSRTATPGISPARDFVLASSFNLVTIRYYHSAESVPLVWHSGRDTLLETRLLRI
jgi:hypothetical protein